MGQAYVCDVTGQVQKGQGAASVDLPLGDERFLRVTVFMKTGERRFEQGVISPEGEALIKAAFKAFGPAPAKKG
jgi:hypothetical protein